MTARIGVLGGTFDPIHIGHLVVAVNAKHALSLDRVMLVVANEPWQKVGARELTPARDRLAVATAAVAGVEGVEVSDIEIERGGTTYTADTLEDLAALHPEAQLFLIVGTDVADDLHTWKRVEVIQNLTTLAVVNRPGAQAVKLPDGWRTERVDIPALDVSSSEIRTRAAAGLPLDYLVPAAAIHCIRERGLYPPR